jgi:hypothetical protein
MDTDNFFDADNYVAITGAISAGGFIIGFVLQYFFLKNLSDLLRAVRPANRRMPPGRVWVLLVSQVNFVLALLVFFVGYKEELGMVYIVATYAIAIFVVVWQFLLVYKVADSIEAEYDSRGIPIEHRPTIQTGLFMAGANAGTLLKDVPLVGWLAGIASFVFLISWIAYWVKTHKYKKELQSMPEIMEEGDSLIFSGL